MANKKNIKLAAQIAVVAGIFTLVVAFMFLINYVNIRQNDPIDNVALEVLVERLSEDAHNDALIEDIRNLDLIARKAFFTGHWQIDVGSWLLLIGAMVTALALRLYFSWSGKIEKPQSDEIKPAVQRLISQRWIAGAGFVVVLLAFMSSFGSDNYLSKYDLPLRTGEEMEGLDYTEHGGTAYPDFGISSYSSGHGVSGMPSGGAPGMAPSGKPVSDSM